MKISVLIIAHNEEKYIEGCISSILEQDQKADEIVLVAHNSTDKTIDIARKFPITVIPFSGQKVSVCARVKGIECISGDIVFCIDGDSYAQKNWISEMKSLIDKDVVLVGSWVKFSGGFYNSISNYFNKLSCTKSDNATRWLWGSSFGFLGKDKNKIKDALWRSIEISEKSKATRNPDDYILALFMKRYGSIKITNKTHVLTNVKEKGFIDEVKRNIENLKNGKRIENFLRNVLR